MRLTEGHGRRAGREPIPPPPSRSAAPWWRYRAGDVAAAPSAQLVVLKRFDARLQELGIVAQRSTDRGQDR
jgi:hypothetical protein